MRRIGEYLGLKVPGLAEGRPSVLIGDKVILTDPSDPDGPCYEGCVHEVFFILFSIKAMPVTLTISDEFLCVVCEVKDGLLVQRT